MSKRIAPSAALEAAIEELPAEGLGDELHRHIEVAYWAALVEAGSATDGEARLRCLVDELERDYPRAAARLAEDLPALCTHLDYPLRLRKRLRSTNLVERSLEEVKRPVHRERSRVWVDADGAAPTDADAGAADGVDAGVADGPG